MSDVVVVESPAKAKTINKYLGDGYTVLASFGHVRDLPPKDGSVRPDEDFAMDWESDERGNRQVSAIAKAIKRGTTLYLATDPDREGEAISWHVRAMLEDRHALDGVTVHRVTFNEITRNAVTTAMAKPRLLDQPLIEAYLARRALDYLVGFTLSPVLWRKLPGSRSAGRVQSVALRLVCEREAEIEAFRAREYWSIEAHLATPAGAPFLARLTHLNGRKLDQFDLPNAAAAEAARAAVEAGAFSVSTIERRRVRRNPNPPFTTSTLQQEASRKLGFGAQQTMRVAQQLYEGIDIGGETVGLITYMRTDGVQMAREAVHAIRDHVKSAFGGNYLPAAPREYNTKAKNAQEAHEAIRPTDVDRRPEDVARALSHDQARLYELIWKRAVASQMSQAEFDQVTVDMADVNDPRGAGAGTTLRANGSLLAFDGFLKLYREDRDDQSDDDDETRVLPAMTEGDPLTRRDVRASQHFTQPPPRYTEASLVKKMEELGIGRPSTYASTLSVLRDRNYVRLDAKRLVPEDRGRLVTAFLTSFFTRYVDPGFTASLEEKLDEISDGRADWRAVMRAFWHDFSEAVEQTRELKITDVINALDDDLGPHFFPPRADGGDPRLCPACNTGRLGLKLGRHGSFIGCSNYPACQYTRRLTVNGEDGDETLKEGMRVLGPRPDDGRGHHRPPRPLRPLRPAGRAAAGRTGRQEGEEGKAEADVAAARRRRRDHHAGAGARPADAATADRHTSGEPRADGGRDRPVRALHPHGLGLCFARPRRRRAERRPKPGCRPAGEKARRGADARAASQGWRGDHGQEGAVRPLRAAWQGGREPPAQPLHGRHHARGGHRPARREGARAEAEAGRAR